MPKNKKKTIVFTDVKIQNLIRGGKTKQLANVPANKLDQIVQVNFTNGHEGTLRTCHFATLALIYDQLECLKIILEKIGHKKNALYSMGQSKISLFVALIELGANVKDFNKIAEYLVSIGEDVNFECTLDHSGPIRPVDMVIRACHVPAFLFIVKYDPSLNFLNRLNPRSKSNISYSIEQICIVYRDLLKLSNKNSDGTRIDPATADSYLQNYLQIVHCLCTQANLASKYKIQLLNISLQIADSIDNGRRLYENIVGKISPFVFDNNHLPFFDLLRFVYSKGALCPKEWQQCFKLIINLYHDDLNHFIKTDDGYKMPIWYYLLSRQQTLMSQFLLDNFLSADPNEKNIVSFLKIIHWKEPFTMNILMGKYKKTATDLESLKSFSHLRSTLQKNILIGILNLNNLELFSLVYDEIDQVNPVLKDEFLSAALYDLLIENKYAISYFEFFKAHGVNFNALLTLDNFTLSALQMALLYNADIEIIKFLLNESVDTPDEASFLGTLKLAAKNVDYFACLLAHPTYATQKIAGDHCYAAKIVLKQNHLEAKRMLLTHLKTNEQGYFLQHFDDLMKFAIVVGNTESINLLCQYLPDIEKLPDYLLTTMKLEKTEAFNVLFSHNPSLQTKIPENLIQYAYMLYYQQQETHFFEKMISPAMLGYLQQTQHPLAAAILTQDENLVRLIYQLTPEAFKTPIEHGIAYCDQKITDIIVKQKNNSLSNIFAKELPIRTSQAFYQQFNFLLSCAIDVEYFDEKIEYLQQKIAKILKSQPAENQLQEKKYKLEYALFSFFELITQQYMAEKFTINYQFLFVDTKAIRNKLTHQDKEIEFDQLKALASVVVATPIRKSSLKEPSCSLTEYIQGFQANESHIIQQDDQPIREQFITEIEQLEKFFTQTTKAQSSNSVSLIDAITWSMMRISVYYQAMKHLDWKLLGNQEQKDSLLEECYRLRCYLAHEKDFRETLPRESISCNYLLMLVTKLIEHKKDLIEILTPNDLNYKLGVQERSMKKM